MRFALIAVLAAVIGAPCALAADAPKTPANDATLAADAAKTPASDTAAPAPAAHALKIGYVDISRVWNAYRRNADLHADLKAFGAALAEQNRTRTEEIARYNREIEKLAMGTPERLELEEKMKTAVKETEEFRRNAARQFDEKFVAALNQLFGEVLQEIEAIAKEGNYDLILKDQTPDPNVSNPDEEVIQLGQRVVLYAKPEYDLTSLVIQRLNDKYEAERKKKEAAPEPAKQPKTPTQEK